MSVFRVIQVCVFLHSDRIRRDMEYLFLVSPNAGNTDNFHARQDLWNINFILSTSYAGAWVSYLTVENFAFFYVSISNWIFCSTGPDFSKINKKNNVLNIFPAIFFFVYLCHNLLCINLFLNYIYSQLINHACSSVLSNYVKIHKK